ncbi:MAG TPA: prolyl-tRNA synthetase associated domain-containing protein [Candidatus Saccharimonadales bacterium]|nr:prolyl-tRNA synthetase associated domain-containing protein [Candidatus Saccharimonadales bacterium]
MQDQALKSYLEKLGISYKEYGHKPVFTVDEAAFLKNEIPGMHTKNLFLKDDRGNFYLVCIAAEKRLDMKALRKRLGAGKLQFATPEEMKAELNLTPGSVSLFGIIYSKRTRLLLDKDIWDAAIVSFHANINTETLELRHEGLEKFYNSLRNAKEIMVI